MCEHSSLQVKPYLWELKPNIPTIFKTEKCGDIEYTNKNISS